MDDSADGSALVALVVGYIVLSQSAHRAVGSCGCPYRVSLCQSRFNGAQGRGRRLSLTAASDSACTRVHGTQRGSRISYTPRLTF